MHIPLKFHPKFLTYSIPGKGVYAISELDCLFFTENSFPFIQDIFNDNQKSNPSSAITIQHPQIYNLVKSNILCSPQDPNNYVRPADISFSERSLKQWDLISFSHSNKEWENQWIALIDDIYNKYPKTPKLNIIFVDDFLTPNLSEQFSNTKLNCVIKITGDNFWISPIFSNEKTVNFNKLCTRIANNQSVKQFFQRKFENDKYIFYPFKLENEMDEELKSIASTCLQSIIGHSKQTLSIINRENNTIDEHPGLLSLTEKNNGNGVKIELQNTISKFSDDGGSRIYKPEQTVARISNYISPISGLITFFKPLNGSENSAITIYKTAFSSTPYPETSYNTIEDNYNQICLGKGISKPQSQASALSEALERHAALFTEEDIKLFTKSSPDEIEDRYYLFHQLQPLSDNQYNHYKAYFENSKADLHTDKYNNASIYWKKVWSLTHNEEVQLPAVKCYKFTPFIEMKYGRWNSNGCASGNTTEEAILQGLFELIERDACAIWWYNQITRPSFDLNLIPQQHLTALESTLSDQYDYWVLDITNDIGVPVMAAICRDKTTQKMCFGFGCHLQPVLAAQRALTELCQILSIIHKNGAIFNFDTFYESEFLLPDNSAKQPARQQEYSGNFKTDITQIVNTLRENNIETLVLNYNRKESPLCAVKVFTPGLCHVWPEFGNERLYTVPLKMGWLEECNTENSLNRTPLLI